MYHSYPLTFTECQSNGAVSVTSHVAHVFCFTPPPVPPPLSNRERREEELRDAYRRARTPEEASSILQRYAQRFSISDAVLERLQLPKLLDRSISADPSFPCSPYPLSLSLSASPTTPDPFDMDPNGPMRYLRQQSAPAPKFTSTLEARIEEFPKDSSHQRPQIRSRSSEPPTTRGLSPKPVPLLSPKPYFQSRPTSAEPWPSKVRLILDSFFQTNHSPTIKLKLCAAVNMLYSFLQWWVSAEQLCREHGWGLDHVTCGFLPPPAG